MSVRESVIYQEILEEGSILGELKRARLDLIRFGQKRFGALDPVNREQIQSCTDLDRLDRMLDRVLDAPDWASLLATE